MIKKLNKYIFTLIIVIIFSPINIYAWNGGIPNINPGGGGGNGGTGKPPGGTIDYGTDSSGWKYTCEYTYYVSTFDSITVDIYNKDDEILNPTFIIPNEETLAGTSVGVNIYQKKIITWKVLSAEVTRTQETDGYYWCTYMSHELKHENGKWYFPKPSYRCNSPCSNCQPNAHSILYWRYHDGTSRTETVTTGEYYDRCQEDAEKKAKSAASGSQTPSYNVTYPDSNDINGNNTTVTTGNGSCQTGTNRITCMFSYNVEEKTCMNVKTSKVSYKSKCGTEEIEVPKGSDHWHYFIPLNAKSNSDFSINIMSKKNTQKFNQEQCNYVIDNYSDYEKLLILDLDGTTLSNQSGVRNETKIKNHKNEVKNGCYLATVIDIPIEQKFYNETEEYKLKGFNFYFKPIDISNPFPNSLDKDSYWYGLYDNSDNTVKVNNKKVDLDNSFSKLKYSVDVSNINKIREYNQINSYTSWDNMYINGKSKFIKEIYEGYKVGKEESDFYNLGCGPANEDWSECKK